MNSNSEQGGRSRKWLIIGLAVVAIAVVASVLFFLNTKSQSRRGCPQVGRRQCRCSW